MMKAKRANRTEYMESEADRKIQLGNAVYTPKKNGEPAMFWVKSKSRPNASYQFLKSDVEQGIYKHLGCWSYNVNKWCSHAEAVKKLFDKLPKKKIPNSRKKKRG